MRTVGGRDPFYPGRFAGAAVLVGYDPCGTVLAQKSKERVAQRARCGRDHVHPSGLSRDGEPVLVADALQRPLHGAIDSQARGV